MVAAGELCCHSDNPGWSVGNNCIVDMTICMQFQVVFARDLSWRKKRLSDVWGEVDWLLNVTINDILVIYVTAHWCAGGKRVHLMYFWTVTVIVVIMTSVTIKVNRPRYRIQTHYTIMNRVAPLNDISAIYARQSTDTGLTFLYGDSDTPLL